MFLGACSFIATCFNATANGPFGSSFYIRQTSSAISSGKVRGASARRPRDIAAVVFGAVVFLLEVGRAIVWGALLLLALLAWCCLLLGCLPALRCAALLLGSFLLQRGTPFWFVLVPAGGNCFALGTGGIRWSLPVGGLGPVLSIPKLCFKPFRKNDPPPPLMAPWTGSDWFAKPQRCGVSRPATVAQTRRCDESEGCLHHLIKVGLRYRPFERRIGA